LLLLEFDGSYTVSVFGGFLVSSWRLWESQDKLGVHGSRPTVPEMENGYS
jgi:hypothetical protein